MEYEEVIATLKREKEELTKEVETLNKRNSNQAILLKRLESARQDDRKMFEAQISELKFKLSEERIKTRRAFLQNSPLAPSASQRSVMSSPSMTNNAPSRGQSDGNYSRQVSEDDRKNWKESTAEPTSSDNGRQGNPARVQGALLGAAVKKKKRKEKQNSFWDLFGSTEEEDADDELTRHNAALLQKTEEDRTSLLTKEIKRVLEENKRVFEEREQELLAREEVQRVKEDAIRKSQMHQALNSSFGMLGFGGDGDDEKDSPPAPRTPDDVNMDNISKMRDSDVLDVDTLRRLIAARTAGMKEEDVTKTSMVLDMEAKENSESDYGPEHDDE